jgi:sec-independent protein translocase protein TatA
MGSMSLWHWIVVIAVVLLLFGRGKISELMGDMAQGIKAFKKGMSEDEKAAAAEPAKNEPVKTIDHQPAPAAGTAPSADLKPRAETERRFEGSTS